jgi:formylglycine-generating enzyme required for sulfatase activity
VSASWPDPLVDLRGIEDNEYNLHKLTEQIQTPIGVIPFVGAGLSVPFGFPTWSSFLIAQAKRAGIEDQIQQCLQAGEYEGAAEDLLEARGHRAFCDAIDAAFGTYKLEGMKLTGAVSYLPRLAAGPVITTNFDHVLEEVFQQAGCAFEHVVWGVRADLATQALHQSRRFLLKIHGDVEDSTDRILTRQDYEERYGSADGTVIDVSKPLPRLLEQMLLARPLLFLGCSLNQDRTVAVLKRITQDYPSVAHYAVVEQPASTEELRERSRFLSGCNIRPIWYPNQQHNLVESLLAHLVGQDAWPEMVLIPAGEFLMGSDPQKDQSARDEEQPQRRLYLPDYYIAKTPVTNAQYLAFAEATGNQPYSGWEDGRPPEGKENHPVVTLSWHDAMAYCQWLSEVTGKPYRLPSEAEWEKAARGGLGIPAPQGNQLAGNPVPGRLYPWGDQWDPRRCSADQGNKGDTTPVGQYSPRGDSPYGCADMAGNVFEWTRSLWGKEHEKPDFMYPYDPQDGRENPDVGDDVYRVVRGGSFASSRDYARCARRHWVNPDYRYSNIGMRVVVSPISGSGR